MSDVEQAGAQSRREIARAVEASRDALEETLDAIEDKLNVPKRVGELTERARHSYQANPVPWIVGATAAVLAIGGLVAWAIFGDD